MNLVFSLTGFVMVLGLLIHLLVPPDRPSDKGPVYFRARIIEIGRLMFACGLLALLFWVGKRMLID